VGFSDETNDVGNRVGSLEGTILGAIDFAVATKVGEYVSPSELKRFQFSFAFTQNG
jgi:hypothetical protein